MACLVLAQGGVNVLDDRLGVPLSGTAVPVVEADFAAKVHHQGFERGGGVELKAHIVQLLFGRGQFWAETA